MKFGLRNEDLDFITQIILQISEIEKAAIFGSRAKGNYKPGSDVDIAIWGNNVSLAIVSKLHAVLEEESPMPYFFDIVDYTHLNHPELQNHIDRAGIVFYNRSQVLP